jgi:N-acyl-D-amino-acid deacylase
LSTNKKSINERELNMNKLLVIFLVTLTLGCSKQHFDLLIQDANVVDGTGNPRYEADIGVSRGKIVLIRPEINGNADKVIKANGMIVSPGFIDMLSWACGPIVYDGTVPSVVQQGITTAVFGEGWSMGPVNANVKKEMSGWWEEYKIPYDWHSLYEYEKMIEKQGTSVNIASYVGATTVRLYVIGYEDRKATPEELEQMKQLVRDEMKKGAVGVASSLVYTPAFYANTEELIELAKVAAEYDGVYASHIRGEGTDLVRAMKEFIEICKKAHIRGEVYHLKASGKENWAKLDSAIQIIENARSRGLKITADIYPYTAGATGLKAMIPPWAKDGGPDAMVERLKNPVTRKRIKNEILNSYTGWENFYWMAGDGSNILVSYLSDKNKAYQGKTIAEISKLENKDELDTIFDLLIDEAGGGGGIYFYMSEDNVRKKMRLPWVSFCTDEDAYQPVGLMSQRNPHPRSYGTFPKILGQYVRDENIISLEEAIRKTCGLPAEVLGFNDRGTIKVGKAADLVIFNPDSVKDMATYTQPHQFPKGLRDVIVNGGIVVRNYNHTGLKPGKALLKPVAEGETIEKN